MAYSIEGSTDLEFGNPAANYIVPPSFPGAIIEPDGRFYLADPNVDLNIHKLPGMEKEFYKVSVTMTNSVGTSTAVSGGR
jgi:hypothetical protein